MMDSLSGITAFVQVAETRSFTEAGRLLEVSSSAIGKSVARMEQRLGVRLFHRSTRSVTLTAEGELFLERCRRILLEIEQAEIELSQLAEVPKGKLRISVPLQNTLIFPLLSGFMQAYPDIELDVDLSDRMVEVIEEGFDAVIRTGQPFDSRLMARKLGEYKLELVASPA
jgi:DNA-binding transcriptional LysR family regulator